MMNFLAVTWNVDPVMLNLWGFKIMWYGLCWMIALGGGAFFFKNFIDREKLDPRLLDRAFWWGVIATMVGARLGHCLFYDPVHYLTHPIELLYIRQGGMASHGAAVGLLLGLWAFSKRSKLPYIWVLDRVMIPVTVGGAVVRFGNLLNSEIYGHATELPWGFIFVRAGETVPKHPTQIYEALCYLATFAVLLFLYYRKNMGARRPGLMFGVGLLGVFLSRFLLEFIKNPQIAAEETMLINIGQILSLPFIIAGIVMIIWPYTKRKLTPDPNRWAGLKEYKDPHKPKSKTPKK
ncbi:MAG: prolipoprotein diacylglyceryl transferase [Alistipes sp.]|jgi:prolipoprotein diacylglyceryl transferase|nr:prolipoprotein diacylglyceryl transferase [Alistipes sp.]